MYAIFIYTHVPHHVARCSSNFNPCPPENSHVDPSSRRYPFESMKILAKTPMGYGLFPWRPIFLENGCWLPAITHVSLLAYEFYYLHSLKLTASLPVKIDGWKTILSFWV